MARIKIVKCWYYGSALDKHYSEGTDYKQIEDRKIFSRALNEINPDYPEWLKSPLRAPLKSAIKDGARGEMVLSLINSKQSKDWFIDSIVIGRGSHCDKKFTASSYFPKSSRERICEKSKEL